MQGEGAVWSARIEELLPATDDEEISEDELKERVARKHRRLLAWVAKRREKEMEESMKRVRKMKPPPENWEGMIKYRLEGLTNSRESWLEYP